MVRKFKFHDDYVLQTHFATQTQMSFTGGVFAKTDRAIHVISSRVYSAPSTPCTRIHTAGENSSKVHFVSFPIDPGTHQATSDPKLAPGPAAPVWPGTNTNTNNANPARMKNLGPPYPVDEASFTDGCKRLASVQDSFSRLPGGGNGNGNVEGNSENDRWSCLGGGRAESGGGYATAVDAMVSAELLMRSLGCLASFRCSVNPGCALCRYDSFFPPACLCLP